MSLANIFQTLEQYFDGAWVLADAKVSYASADLRKFDTLPIVRFLPQPGPSLNTGIKGCIRRTGFVAVFIYVAEAEGSLEAYDLADKVVAIMENKRIGNIITYEANVFDRGVLKSTSVRVFEVSTTYETEEIT